MEVWGHKMLPHPNTHCKLNPIELYYCWRYARQQCDYTLEGQRQTVPLALAAVERGAILGFNQSVRDIEACRGGLKYGCAGFNDRVYKAHRRIDDSTKW